MSSMLMRTLPKTFTRCLFQLETSHSASSKVLARLGATSFSPYASTVRATSTTVHVPDAVKAKHNHATHWTIERVVSVAMLPVLPVAFLTDNIVSNYILILLTAAHVHWGLEAIVIDYMRPRVVGQAGYYGSLGFVYILSFATLAGLLYLNYTQMPVTQAVKKVWKAL